MSYLPDIKLDRQSLNLVNGLYFTTRYPGDESIVVEKEDIEEYVRFFVEQFARKMGKRIDRIDKEYIAAMKRHVWHGNVRELRNVVERSLIMTDGNTVTMDALTPDFRMSQQVGTSDSFALEDMERKHILKVMEYTRGNKAEAARLLGIGIATLYRKLESYGIK